MSPTTATLPEGHPSEGSTWLVSLAFWVCLIFAVAIFAVVSLAPPLLDAVTLRQEYHQNRLRLLSVDRQVSRLQQVIDALRHDDTFAQELAWSDFRAAAPDEQRIAVQSPLTLEVRPATPTVMVAPPDLPWYTPVIRLVAEDDAVANLLLCIAAGTILYAFTFLGDRRSAEH